MKKPRIGIPPYFNYESEYEYMPEGYLRAVDYLEAELVTLHYDLPEGELPSLVRSLDGVILSGGVDVDPRFYGQEPIPQCGRINPLRDRMESILLRETLGTRKPILAICRGIQVLNVMMGGSLYQDIPTAFPGSCHQQESGRYTLSHEVHLTPGGLLSTAYDGAETLMTNSFHHQAIDRMAEGLTTEARAAEGFAEACRGTGDQWILGVQWHPEVSLRVDPPSVKIFELYARALKES